MPLDQTTVYDDYRFRRYGVVNEIYDRLVGTRKDHPLKSHLLSFSGVVLNAFKAFSEKIELGFIQP